MTPVEEEKNTSRTCFAEIPPQVSVSVWGRRVEDMRLSRGFYFADSRHPLGPPSDGVRRELFLRSHTSVWLLLETREVRVIRREWVSGGCWDGLGAAAAEHG